MLPVDLLHNYATAFGVLACTILLPLSLLLFKRQQKGFPLTVTLYEKDKVYLFIFPRQSKNVVNYSPFCGKLQLYLKLRGIPFEIRTDKFPGPRGQLPYIELNGEIICDSDNIIHRLERHFPLSSTKKEGLILDSMLESKLQRAIAVSIQTIVEKSLYYLMVYYRWGTDAGWTRVKREFFTSLPFPLGLFVPRLARNSTKDILYKQGTLRLSEEERQRSIDKDLDTLSTFLGDQEFFFGTKQPTHTDLLVYTTLHNFLHLYPDCPLETSLLKRTNLIKFCENMKRICGEI
jgi:glutathione S-transferase